MRSRDHPSCRHGDRAASALRLSGSSFVRPRCTVKAVAYAHWQECVDSTCDHHKEIA